MSQPDGDERCDFDAAFRSLYDEMHRIASRQFSRERAGHTLQPTAVVNEAYLKLAGQAELPEGRPSDILGIAAHAMRQVLIDHARRHRAAKRGGGWRRTTLGDPGFEVELDDLLAVDAALERLDRIDRRLRQVVELRFFGGLTVEETAEALDVTPRTVHRDWAKARAWLHRQLGAEGGDGEAST
ncbi:MAG: ECF-type sigma factor [Gemmatimonadota bacterium]